MRAREFMSEGSKNATKNGKKIDKNYEASLPGVHRVAGGNDRLYDLNRVMMAVAATDGVMKPPVPDGSWGGRNNLAVPYTREEADMLKLAYDMVGVDWDDVVGNNTENLSVERSDTEVNSPIQGFRGYPK